jgi:hypothetical protein
MVGCIRYCAAEAQFDRKVANPELANATAKDAQLSRVNLERRGIGSSPAQPCEATHRPRSYVGRR